MLKQQGAFPAAADVFMRKQRSIRMKKKYAVMDGNTAAAHVAYAFTEVAAIYLLPDGGKGG